MINKKKEKLVYHILSNVLLFIIILIDSILMKSQAVFCFGLLIQLLVGIITFSYNANRIKFVYFSYVFGMIFVSIMYFSLIAEHGVPYFNSQGSDDLFYEKQAFNTTSLNIGLLEFLNNNPLDLYKQLTLYIFILSKMISFGNLFDGYHVFMSRQFNVFLIVFIVNMLYFIVNKGYNFSSKEKTRFLITISIFPNFFYLASYTFRDILSCFLVIVLIWALTHLKVNKTGKGIIYYLFVIFAIVLQFYVRTFVMYIMIIITLINFIDFVPKKYKFVIIIGITSCTSLLFLNEISSIFSEGLNKVDNYAEFRANEKTSGLVSIFTDTPLLPFGIFLRFIYGFIQPNPSFSYLFGDYAFSYASMTTFIGIGTLYILTQIPYAIKGFIKPLDKLSVTFLLFYLVFLASLTFRHLVLIYPFIFLLIARGRENKITKFKEIYQLYILGLIFVYIVYSII
ncbi:hypothetical protein [Virgibacillus sp. JSM 102003]|uniref:hypothetical protein n=1 Tax=Virgibacillus sp. JSM 102003 TaxID=1562108 RepID=UPI0035C0A722